MIVKTAIVSTDRGGHAIGERAIGIAGEDIEAVGRSGENVTPEPGQPTRVLVVEDDRTMRHLVVNYLRDHNIRAASASGREEMIRRFAGAEPDLVILDLRLGPAEGPDLLGES